jgi:hypothetical protein
MERTGFGDFVLLNQLLMLMLNQYPLPGPARCALSSRASPPKNKVNKITQKRWSKLTDKNNLRVI